MAYGEDGTEDAAHSRTAFREAEKKYQLFQERKMKIKGGKRRAGKLITRPIDMSEVLDLHKPSCSPAAGEVVQHTVEGYDGPVYTFTKHPGLMYMPGALPPAQQHALTQAALTEYPDPPARTNHNLHYGPLPGLWLAAQRGLRLNWTRRDDPRAGPSRRLGCEHTPAKPHRYPDVPSSAPVPTPAAAADAITTLGKLGRAEPKEQDEQWLRARRSPAAGPEAVAAAAEEEEWEEEEEERALEGRAETDAAATGSPGSGSERGSGSSRRHSASSTELLAEVVEHKRRQRRPQEQRQQLQDRLRDKGPEQPGQLQVHEAAGPSVEDKLGQPPQVRGAHPNPGHIATTQHSAQGLMVAQPGWEDTGERGGCADAARPSGAPLSGAADRKDAGCNCNGAQDVAASDEARQGSNQGECAACGGSGSSVDGSGSPSGGAGGGGGVPLSFEECWSLGGPGPAAEQLLRKLRWATLGPQFDWTQRQYDFTGSYRRLPPTLESLARQLTEVVDSLQGAGLQVLPPGGAGGYQPDAAIVNYYQQGDVLGGHLDDVERDQAQPIVSVSLGCPAIFLMGGPTKDVAPSALLLRGGDVLLLAGEARRCYHGVPRILEAEPPPATALVLGPAIATADDVPTDTSPASPLDAYTRRSRINISIRTVG